VPNSIICCFRCDEYNDKNAGVFKLKWRAVNEEIFDFFKSDNRLYAKHVLTNTVSPPTAGQSVIYNIEDLGGSLRYVASVCICQPSTCLESWSVFIYPISLMLSYLFSEEWINISPNCNITLGK
jgi:hypothetical protein